jgi:hypothetical protein
MFSGKLAESSKNLGPLPPYWLPCINSDMKWQKSLKRKNLKKKSLFSDWIIDGMNKTYQ